MEFMFGMGLLYSMELLFSAGFSLDMRPLLMGKGTVYVSV